MRAFEPDLAGCAVLVTGGQSGIGRAVALLLARLNAGVVIKGRRLHALEEVLDRVAAPLAPSDRPAKLPAVEGLAHLNEQMHRLNVLAIYGGLQRVHSRP